MTSYDGGCFCCGGHKGEFSSSLPNGVCVDASLAGAFFCDKCVENIGKIPNLLEKMIDKWKNPRQWVEGKTPDSVHLKDCNARIFVKKEDLPEATRDILYPEEKREQENIRLVLKKASEVGVGVDTWPGQTRQNKHAEEAVYVRFVPGETGIICKACNFPMLMEPFEWDSELKRCDNCGTYTELRPDAEIDYDGNMLGSNFYIEGVNHDTDDDRHRSDRLPTEKDLPEAEEKEEAQA